MKRRISPRRGETLVEIIVSFLILSTLLMGAAFMTQTALRITSSSLQAAATAQDAANEAVVSGYVSWALAPPPNLTIAFNGNAPAQQSVIIHNDGGLLAFTPVG
jgi:Tfp pilus assembly protein PilV